MALYGCLTAYFYYSALEFPETPLYAVSNNALIAAVLGFRLENVKVLVGAGANVNYENYRGITPLIAGISVSDTNAVRYLIRHGGDMFLINRYNKSAAEYAVDLSNTDVLEMLIEDEKGSREL